MWKTHWNQYTAGLARDAKARKAAATEKAPEPVSTAPDSATPAESEVPKRSRAKPAQAVEVPEETDQGDT